MENENGAFKNIDFLWNNQLYMQIQIILSSYL